MGWDAGSIEIAKLNDIEDTEIELAIQTTVSSSLSLKDSSIKIIYSTNNFTTKNSAFLSFNQTRRHDSVIKE